MKVIGVIPARMGSSRFPGKPLYQICGIPMIEHVYRRSAMSTSLSDVYVATCDTEIFDVVVNFGGKAIMTDICHERCTDRVAEAVKNIDADIVVIIQGDEPLVFPDMIDAAIKPLLEDASIVCSNLMAEIKSDKDFNDPNEVKVVVDQQNFALYFSREAIPSTKKSIKYFKKFKQVCIMPFTKKFLFTYSALSPTPLEEIESVDMMRILEHGYKLKLVLTDHNTISVDTKEDLMEVEMIMETDPLFTIYKAESLLIKT
jgi:3-deoxy-manno-octulosonate cytidylyltransferase (CMP-KDO synthetase)